MYEVILENKAERDLNKFPQEKFSHIVSHIKALKQNPRPSGCRKLKGAKSHWRIRVGDYRIVYEIDEKEKVIRVMRVRHRREAYR